MVFLIVMCTFFLGYILFPDSAFYNTLIKWIDRLMMGGGRQRW